MTYTLKVDWAGRRTQAVIRVLREAGQPALRKVAKTLGLYVVDNDLDSIETIKLDAHASVLDAVEEALSHWLRITSPELALRARNNEPGLTYEEIVSDQRQVFAALQEIREYREVTREAIVRSANEGMYAREAIADMKAHGTWPFGEE